MLDIKYIKDNLDYVKTRLSDRQTDYSCDLDRACALYLKRNEFLSFVEKMKARQNAVSKEMPKLKKEGGDVSGLLDEMKQLSDKVKESETDLKKIDAELEEVLLYIPNVPAKDVPVGKDDTENVEIRRFGTPRKFNFNPLPHWEIGTNLGILDPERAAKVTGSRFHFYIGDGARLERAIINYFLDSHAKAGYTEILPPYMVNRKSMRGTGQLPKFEEDAFKLIGLDYFMVPTAEVPVTNFHADEILILDEKCPTIKYCAYSANWRLEIGSAGRDTRGLIRQHQFNKVELVKFTTPENSYEELEKLTSDAEKILQGLGFAYRVSLLCTGDMGFCSAKTYDLEVYLPSYEKYVEISSCSNFEDYQSRRANIRFKKTPKDKAQLAYTLNGSGVAVGRTTACILENYQNEDGSVTVPEVLRPYMGGQDKIIKR